VAGEFFLEWHQNSYTKSIEEFVYTKLKLDEKDSRRPRTANPHLAKERAAHDFRVRKPVQHKCKYSNWKEEDSPRPSVVIATFGCIASTLGTKSEDIRALVNFKEIDMLIVDESSQLWVGNLVGALSAAFPKLKNLVIVGDEKQLPPHGEDKIPNLESLLSAALKLSTTIPNCLLDETWRLPTCIATFISNNMYDGKLDSRRSDHLDSIFRTRLGTIIRNTDGPLRFLLDRMTTPRPNGPLAWIHHNYPSHTNAETKSSGNRKEADLITRIAAKLLKCCDTEGKTTKTSPMRVVILTAYLEV
jgi:superfamily I DNA and/or RNA helicase